MWEESVIINLLYSGCHAKYWLSLLYILVRLKLNKITAPIGRISPDTGFIKLISSVICVCVILIVSYLLLDVLWTPQLSAGWIFGAPYHSRPGHLTAPHALSTVSFRDTWERTASELLCIGSRGLRQRSQRKVWWTNMKALEQELQWRLCTH